MSISATSPVTPVSAIETSSPCGYWGATRRNVQYGRNHDAANRAAPLAARPSTVHRRRSSHGGRTTGANETWDPGWTDISAPALVEQVGHERHEVGVGHPLVGHLHHVGGEQLPGDRIRLGHPIRVPDHLCGP